MQKGMIARAGLSHMYVPYHIIKHLFCYGSSLYLLCVGRECLLLLESQHWLGMSPPA